MIARILTATTLIQDMGGVLTPCTVTFQSSDATRKIEVSADGGFKYFVLTPNVSTASQIVFFLKNKISHLRVTGVINDIITILEA